MDKVALLSVWNQVFPTSPPPGLRTQLMVPVLAYRILEGQFGGLSQSARKRLDALIAKNRAAPNRAAKATKLPEATSRLIRGWRGEIHEVLVVDSGFVYRGETYKSLSPIARKVTGTQWSGPAFFGTKTKGPK